MSSGRNTFTTFNINKMNKNSISRFKGFYENLGTEDFWTIMGQIKEGEWKAEIEEIRRLFNEGKTKEADAGKKKLTGFTPGAPFDGRRLAENMTEYNYRITLDYDDIAEEVLPYLKEMAKKQPYTETCCVSPRGHGLKITVRVRPEDGQSPSSVSECKEFHHRAYLAVSKHYDALMAIPVDPSGKDITRLYFVTYDPDAYLNPDAEEFPVGKAHAEPKEKKSIRKNKSKLSPITLMQIICYILEEDYGETYAEGNRNNYVYRLAKLCNRYGVERAKAEDYVLRNFADLTAEERKQIMENGYSQTEEFATLKLNTVQTNIYQIKIYIREHYALRFNLIKDCIEYYPLAEGSDQKFTLLEDKTENSIWTELRENGTTCNINNVHNILYSGFSPDYNPLKEYFDRLPEWDGTDHVKQLASLVKTNDDDFWLYSLHVWLRAMVACALDPKITNQGVLVFTGAQNIGKTRFFNRLLPAELEDYRSSGSINPKIKDDLTKLFRCIMINLDEFEGLSGKELALMKEAITRDIVLYRPVYGRNLVTKPRCCSFTATTNQTEFLYDQTGNRRFIVFTVTDVDNDTAIPYEQLYAQVKHELSQPGCQLFFTDEDVRHINNRNEEYQQYTIEEESFLTNFRKPEKNDKISYFTCGQICEIIHSRNGLNITHTNKCRVSALLKKLNFECKRTTQGRKYAVCLLEMKEVMNNQYIEDSNVEEGLSADNQSNNSNGQKKLFS